MQEAQLEDECKVTEISSIVPDLFQDHAGPSISQVVTQTKDHLTDNGPREDEDFEELCDFLPPAKHGLEKELEDSEKTELAAANRCRTVP